MSGYLMRLVMRGHGTSEAQPMQPFVRTTSPVAERDQRIGMMGFEGFELGEASFAEGGSEAGAEQGDIVQPPVLPPRAMTADETGIATVQRKMASRPAGMASSGTPTARGEAAVVDAQTQARVQSPSSGAGAPHLADAPDVSLLPSGPPMSSPVSSAGGIHPEALRLGDSQSGDALLPFSPTAVHTRSLRPTRQVDSTHLEPSPGALAEHFKPPLERTSGSRTDTNEGPRVVIGRINVEVFPPPAAPPSTAAPRPGPMTAASVSVIGPLSGGVHPNLHLSLRHR